MAFSSKTITFLVATLTVLVVGYEAAATESGQLKDFNAIGTVNKKTYYIPKNEEKMNWFSARGLCTDFGLEIATFKTEQEFQFVRTNVPEDTQLWIGAAMKGLKNDEGAQAFEWLDGSDITIPNFHQYSKHYICLIFSQDHHLYSDFCIAGKYKPLCQKSA